MVIYCQNRNNYILFTFVSCNQVIEGNLIATNYYFIMTLICGLNQYFEYQRQIINKHVFEYFRYLFDKVFYFGSNIDFVILIIHFYTIPKNK